ncbi:GNAT family N-acetyltransferase [Chitinophaga pendula]|uniref:GNAT family N-acetyltransferase n=1 Tax=Chitinophaga TaxID=79328 RepID=UPI0018E055BF|nr:MULTISPECIES: GNAT family N-acetyltransferase [Chitinophaga]UCJ07648.1 GNAT family N-acetyltransferase [Chitinophaga pendula]
MIQFNNLAGQSPETICNTFNYAFSDYVIPFKINLPLFQQKVQGENIQLPFSVGAFDNDQLVAFMLHGTDDNGATPTRLYNGGTGVTPSHRGQRLVQQMYAQAIPSFITAGIRELILEVISTNTPAIKAYGSCGFRQSRVFHCFKGNILPAPMPENIRILNTQHPDWQLLASFSTQQPSWSNSLDSIRREGNNTTTWLAYKHNEIIGFISVFTGNCRIRQIAVHPDHRRQGIGQALLSHVATTLRQPLTIINVEEENTTLQKFLLNAGCQHTISQYEMICQL